MIGNIIQDLFTKANDYPAAGCAVGDADAADRGDGAASTSAAPGRRTCCERLRAAFGRWLSQHLVLIRGLLVLVYTFIPIAVVVLMSFNKPRTSKLIYKFDSFTLHNWLHPCADPSMCHAARAQHRDRAARHRGRHDPRHAGGVRAGAAPSSSAARRPTC